MRDFIDFYTRVHAKYILSGEYATIYGGPAIVIPIPSFCLHLQYWQTDASFRCTVNDRLLYINHIIPKEFVLKGRIIMQTNFPLSSGLGGSATICVALARLILSQNETDTSLFNLAHTLEHHFHGKSSGADIAGVLADQPIIYRQGQPVEMLNPTWCPNIELTHTGIFSGTKTTGIPYNADMDEATNAMIHALRNEDHHLLQSAIIQGHACFKQWGLIPPPVADHIQYLYEEGAKAVKPTGSGNGGFVLSLWDEGLPYIGSHHAQ